MSWSKINDFTMGQGYWKPSEQEGERDKTLFCCDVLKYLTRNLHSIPEKDLDKVYDQVEAAKRAELDKLQEDNKGIAFDFNRIALPKFAPGHEPIILDFRTTMAESGIKEDK